VDGEVKKRKSKVKRQKSKGKNGDGWRVAQVFLPGCFGAAEELTIALIAASPGRSLPSPAHGPAQRFLIFAF